MAVVSVLASLGLGVSAYAQAPKAAQSKDTNSSTLQPNISANTVVLANSDQAQLKQQLIALAKQKQLATHPSWLRLHYYEETGHKKQGQSPSSVYKSKITNPDFFISKEGKSDPPAELEAFITATIEQGKDGNDSVACRFPARTYWLKQQLGLEQVESDCPDFDTWLQKLDPRKLSVVFAEEYPDRPVSAFGHTLMLIDSAASLADPQAIDKAHALNDTVWKSR